jgi:hypothetical protein
MEAEEEVPDTEDTEDCVICCDGLTENNSHTLGCGHCFHTACVVHWFRRGAQTCPSCRDPGHSQEESAIGALALHARASALRQFSRRKSAPKTLVTMVKKLQKTEKNLAEAKAALRRYHETNKGIINEGRRLRSKEFRCLRKRSVMMRAVGLYEGGEHRLPPLLINTANPNDLRSGRR